jgi:hypothetical protein
LLSVFDSGRVEAILVESQHNFLSRYTFLLGTSQENTTNTNAEPTEAQEEEIDLGSDSDDGTFFHCSSAHSLESVGHLSPVPSSDINFGDQSLGSSVEPQVCDQASLTTPDDVAAEQIVVSRMVEGVPDTSSLSEVLTSEVSPVVPALEAEFQEAEDLQIEDTPESLNVGEECLSDPFHSDAIPGDTAFEDIEILDVSQAKEPPSNECLVAVQDTDFVIADDSLQLNPDEILESDLVLEGSETGLLDGAESLLGEEADHSNKRSISEVSSEGMFLSEPRSLP